MIFARVYLLNDRNIQITLKATINKITKNSFHHTTKLSFVFQKQKISSKQNKTKINRFLSHSEMLQSNNKDSKFYTKCIQSGEFTVSIRRRTHCGITYNTQFRYEINQSTQRAKQNRFNQCLDNN